MSRMRWLASEPARATRQTYALRRSSFLTGLWQRARMLGRLCPSMSAQSITSFRRYSWQAFTTRPLCGRMWRGRSSTSRLSAKQRVLELRPMSRIPIITRRALPIAMCWSWVLAQLAFPPPSRQPARAHVSFCATSNLNLAARFSPSCMQRWMASPQPNG